MQKLRTNKVLGHKQNNLLNLTMCAYLNVKVKGKQVYTKT